MAKKTKTKTLSQLKRQLDAVFSKAIRLRASDSDGRVQCFTCDRVLHWKEAHAGHFVSRRYLATRFDERNVQVQCAGCNTFHAGRTWEFGKNLNKIYGVGTAELLKAMERRPNQKIQRHEYLELIERYKRKSEQSAAE